MTFVIAEAGVNHNGSLELAKDLVRAASDCGVDAVKFQTFDAAALASQGAPLAEYQRPRGGGQLEQLEMLRALELSHEDHFVLRDLAAGLGVLFMSSPFDQASLRFLVQDLGVSQLKIGSGELTSGPLLLDAARSGLPVILSTGMSDLVEVEAALGVLAFGWSAAPDAAPSRAAFARAFQSEDGTRALKANLTLLHCTTQYPAPFEDINLRAMATLRTAFDLPVGFSDHTPGIAMPIAATALGAVVIEKHFTLDRTLPGPDHQASLEVAELAEMVEGVRQVEKALGDGVKGLMRSERANRAVARKSLVAASRIVLGERFSEHNLACKRPGGGRSPMDYWDVLGQEATRDYDVDDFVEEEGE